MDDPPRPIASREGAHPGTVLVIGAGGFIGGFIVGALRRQGWRVLRGVRGAGRALADDERACDLDTLLAPDDWAPLLAGVDVVVNAAGILRQTRAQTFDAIHFASPLALARACVECGVQRFVQISALGIVEDGEFIASKHRFDDALMALPLSSVVLRPSVIYSVAGSYGGTSLLRALAAFPPASLLPGDGRWQVQPLAAEDLAEIVARAAGGTQSGIHELGGPAPMSLRDYQHHWRAWLRIGNGRMLAVPEAWVGASVRVMEAFGTGPVGETMWRMLRRGNITAPDASLRTEQAFGLRPRSLEEALATHPSQVQDRWHAQLYFLAPALRWAVVVLWLVSAWVGFNAPIVEVQAMVHGTWLESFNPVLLARAGGAIDLLLGAWLISHWRPRTAIAVMLLSVLAYTLVFGIALPSAWFDPLGGLIKNVVVLPALAILWVLSDRR